MATEELASDVEIIAAMPELAPGLVDTTIVPGSGHWVPQESPTVVSAALSHFAR